MGNGQKAAMRREKNAKAAAGNGKSQLKTVSSIVCSDFSLWRLWAGASRDVIRAHYDVGHVTCLMPLL